MFNNLQLINNLFLLRLYRPDIEKSAGHVVEVEASLSPRSGKNAGDKLTGGWVGFNSVVIWLIELFIDMRIAMYQCVI